VVVKPLLAIGRHAANSGVTLDEARLMQTEQVASSALAIDWPTILVRHCSADWATTWRRSDASVKRRSAP